MAGINKAILIGNLGKDPEVKYLDTGVAVANITLATTENYTNKEGEKVSQTEWHDIVLWRGLAEITEKYLKKGSRVYIEGKIRTRKWEDKEGNNRYRTEILANNMTMLGGGSRDSNNQASLTEENSDNKMSSPQDDSASSIEKSETADKKQEDGNDDLPF